MFIARDPYGVRPLYVWDEVKGPNNIFMFASELKVINPFLLALNSSGQQQQQEITQFLPGHYMCIEHDPYFELWMKKELIKYHEISSLSCYCKPI